MIHWELCKKFKFDHVNKWYIHNTESVVENETYKILWDFDVEMDHQISARRPDLVRVIYKQRNCRIMDFVVPADHLKECQKRRGTEKKTREHESDGAGNFNHYARCSHQKIVKGTGRTKNKNTCGEQQNDSTANFGQNTEKSPGDLRRLDFTQNPEKDDQLMLL